MKRNIALALLMIVLAALSRFLPHPPNFTAIGAIALFGGALLGKSNKLMLLAPIAIMLLSDTILELTTGLGFHSGMPFVYLSFVLISVIGYLSLSKKQNFTRIIGASFASSIVFYLITNFGVFIGSTMYTKDLSGLLTCYLAGIPFYNQDVFGSFFFNTVFSDLFFSSILFGVYAYATKSYKGLIKA